MTEVVPTFSGRVPDVYDTVMVPMLFGPYAEVMADRVAALAPARVLEVAAGSGALTRALAAALPDAQIIATDLAQPMLDRAAAVSSPPGVRWQQADQLDLPLPDGSVDVVTSQFGLMFVPDRVAAHREARRVLVDDGRLVVAVWTGLSDNGLADGLHAALADRFPTDPPTFIQRIPHGYGDAGQVVADAEAAGFADVTVEKVGLISRAGSAREVAVGFLTGTPAGREVQVRDGDIAGAIDDVTAELERRYGTGPVQAPMTALVLTAHH